MQPEYLTADADDETRLQCRHIFADGRRCGSPALRSPGGSSEASLPFCYFHHNSRRPIQDAPTRRRRQSRFTLPNPEDRSAIQQGLAQVLQRIASNEIDPRRAGLLLYGFQIASLNLPRPDPNVKPKEPVCEVIHDPVHGLLAPPAELGHDEPMGSAQRLLMELDALEAADLERNREHEAELRRASVDAAAETAARAAAQASAQAETIVGLDIQACAPAAPEAAPERTRRSEANSPDLKILRKKCRGRGTQRLGLIHYSLAVFTSQRHASAGTHGTPSPRPHDQTRSGTAASPHASARFPC